MLLHWLNYTLLSSCFGQNRLKEKPELVCEYDARKAYTGYRQTGSPASCRLILIKNRQNRLFVAIFVYREKNPSFNSLGVGFTPITCSVGFPQFKQFCNQSSASPLTQTCPTLHFLNAYTVVSIGCTPYTSTMNTTFLLITLV